jgi:hypothetical protein
MSTGGALVAAGQPAGAFRAFFGTFGAFTAAAPGWMNNFRTHAQTALGQWRNGVRRAVVDEQGRLTSSFRLLTSAAILSLGLGLTLLTGVPAVVSLGIAGVGIAALNYGVIAQAYQTACSPCWPACCAGTTPLADDLAVQSQQAGRRLPPTRPCAGPCWPWPDWRWCRACSPW